MIRESDAHHSSDSSTTHRAAHGHECLRVLTAREQKVVGGEWVAGTRLSGLPTVRAVVNSVIQTAYELDDPTVIFERERLLYPDHWQHYRGAGIPTLWQPFPAHAIISVSGIDTAIDVADYMNKVFESDRARYPKQGGWTAIAAHSRCAVSLDRNHPFFRYRDTGRLDATCCRFLIVDSMAMEGLNNRYVCIWGAAETLSSVRVAVQRIGRELRVVMLWDGNVLLVPPASHDRVYIITHEAFRSRPDAFGVTTSTAETIGSAIDFIIDMHGATDDILSIEEYISLESADADENDFSRQVQPNRHIRCAVALALGEMLEAGRQPNIGDVVRRYGGAGRLRRQFVRAYAESLLTHTPTTYREIRGGNVVDVDLNAIEDLKQKIMRIAPPEPKEVLEAERSPVETMDAEAAKLWLSRSSWGDFLKQKWAVEDDPDWLRTINMMHRAIDGRLDKYEFDIRQTPAARLTAIADDIIEQLSVDGDASERVRALVFEGAQHHLRRLGARTLAEFDYGGRYCKAEVTFALRDENFVAQLEQWICFTLLRENHLSKLAAVMRFERFWELEEAS